MNNLDKIVEKITSGKFLFTIGSLIVFMFLSVTGKLPMDKVTEILLIVIYGYFTRSQPPKNGGAV